MIVKVTYFGMIAEALGKAEEEIEFNVSSKEVDFKLFFNSLHEKLSEINYSVAVNQEFKEKSIIDATIKEIALLPPFAGG